MHRLPIDTYHARGGWLRGFFARTAATLLLLVAVVGCSYRGDLPRPAPEMLTAGSPLLDRSMPVGDAWLRHHLMLGEYTSALNVLESNRGVTGDKLWRGLQKALVLHTAGEYAASNAAFDWAEIEADRRYTRSATRAAGSLVINDRVLAFTPSSSEMRMIPYYRMLNYLALDDLGSAAVEARKANSLLARLERRGDTGCREDAMVRYLAGLVLSSAGDRNDALVSLRQAELGLRECGNAGYCGVSQALGVDLVRVARSLGISEVADSAAERYSVSALPNQGGELLLLVEHGFVAHRVEEALHVHIYPADLNGVEDDDEESIFAAAARITARLAGNAVERAHWGSALDDHPITQLAHAMDGAYVLRLSWPTARRGVHGPEVRVWVNDSLATVTTVGDLSALSVHELEAQRIAAITRMVARGITKYLISREAEKKAEKKGGEVAGFLLGRLTNLAANELERADTRSWSLLPDQVSMVRAHLPEGEHNVRVEVLGSGGQLLEERDLGMIQITSAGQLVLRSERIWSSGSVAVR
ncbi:hypothetical protein BH23GEM6_BH23GEM6_16420 [soil metagenome]